MNNITYLLFLLWIGMALVFNIGYADSFDECSCKKPIQAFEKVYVCPYNILSTPQGTFHVASNGTMERVRAVRSDWFGTYVLKFKKECPVCGRLYEGDEVEEGYDCPMTKTELLPHLWCD